MAEQKTCSGSLSETKESFSIPKKKKQYITRAKRLEQFLWNEFYDEYLRFNDRVHKFQIPKANSEYFDEFCKDIPTEDEERKETLISKYPLYCTAAITLWNEDGDVTKKFRKKYSITRPIQECTEQFGE